MSSIKSIGLLTTKNEEEIIEEVLTKNHVFFDVIYAIDGSTDRTLEILKKYKIVKHIIVESDLNIHNPLKNKRNICDGIRQYALDLIKENEEMGSWVTLLHGDEIFYHNPKKIIEEAEKEKADGVNWYAMHFFLHTSDKLQWDIIKTLPIEQRVKWYSINSKPWMEFRQFKLKKESRYRVFKHSVVRPSGVTKLFSKNPIYKHYKAYSPHSILNEKKRWGVQHDSIFVDCLKDKKGNYKYAIKFNGDFGEFEIGLKELVI